MWGRRRVTRRSSPDAVLSRLLICSFALSLVACGDGGLLEGSDDEYEDQATYWWECACYWEATWLDSGTGEGTYDVGVCARGEQITSATAEYEAAGHCERGVNDDPEYSAADCACSCWEAGVCPE
jgi:hypothetical protein